MLQVGGAQGLAQLAASVAAARPVLQSAGAPRARGVGGTEQHAGGSAAPLAELHKDVVRAIRDRATALLGGGADGHDAPAPLAATRSGW